MIFDHSATLLKLKIMFDIDAANKSQDQFGKQSVERIALKGGGIVTTPFSMVGIEQNFGAATVEGCSVCELPPVFFELLAAEGQKVGELSKVRVG